jgi:hypothetical protein
MSLVHVAIDMVHQETLKTLISNVAGWWFGTFSHILGIITPTDFHIFQRGRYTTNQVALKGRPVESGISHINPIQNLYRLKTGLTYRSMDRDVVKREAAHPPHLTPALEFGALLLKKSEDCLASLQSQII